MLSDSPPTAIVPTADAKRSKAFYGDVLGLSFVDDDGFALVFQLSGTTLRVTRVEAFKPHPFAVLDWNVDDIDDAVIELGLRRVEFESYRPAAAGRTRDLDRAGRGPAPGRQHAVGLSAAWLT